MALKFLNPCNFHLFCAVVNFMTPNRIHSYIKWEVGHCSLDCRCFFVGTVKEIGAQILIFWSKITSAQVQVNNGYALETLTLGTFGQESDYFIKCGNMGAKFTNQI